MFQRKHSALYYARSITRQIRAHPANRDHPWRALARAARWQATKRVRRSPLDIDYEGLRLRCHRDSGSASNVFYFTSRYDFHEMAFLERYLRPGDGFLDIGANIGTYSLLAASLAGPAARIQAFEPLPVAAARARENFALNGLGHAVVHEVAVSDGPGIVEFMDFDVSSGIVPPRERHRSFTVPSGRLDDIVEGTGIAAAKLDVEGAELAALRGAERLVQRADPAVWMVELIDSQLAKFDTSGQAVVEWLAERDFVPAWFDAWSGRLDLTADVWRHHDNVLFVARPHLDRVLDLVATAGPDRRV